MIISHKYGFIFLHAPKMAGSAVKISLLRHLGPDDLILGVLDDALMQGVWPTRRTMRIAMRPRSAAWYRKALAVPLGGRRAFGNLVNWSVKRHFRDVYGLVTHSGADECQRAFPDEFARYRRIAVTRNPYDYFASAYFWRYRKLRDTERPTFEAFVRAVYDNSPDHRGSDFRRKLGEAFYFHRDGRLALTHVLRYERLGADWVQLVGELGLPGDAELTSAKTHTRQGRDYRTLFNPETRAMVSALCAREIEHFGYTF